MNEIEDNLASVQNRMELWISLLSFRNIKAVAEIGVYKGEFAAAILHACASIQKYFLIDPWRNLPDWNKPANTDNEQFEKFYQQTLNVTEFAAAKRVILRGKTTEVISDIPDGSIDFAYIDGDHTLKGITIDAHLSWSKVTHNGWLAGDDLTPSIWQHNQNFEPSFVFPFVVYFAEAVNCPIHLLPYNQFLIVKDFSGFNVYDYTNRYSNFELRKEFINESKSRDKSKNRNWISTLFNG